MGERPAWWRQAQLAATAVLALAVLALSAWLLLRPDPAVQGEGSAPGAAPVTQVLGGAGGPSASGSPAAPTSAPASGEPLLTATGAPTAPPDGSGVPVAFVGDGVDPAASGTSTGPADWTALLAQSLLAGGQPVDRAVAGQDGAGWAVRSAQGATFATLVPTVVTADTRVVVLFGSRNDLGASSASAVQAGARAALDAVRTAAPSAQVLVVAPPPLEQDVPAALTAQTSALRRAAQTAGAAFLDPIATGWSLGPGATASADGGLRLTPAGQLAIAEHVLPQVRPLVSTAG